MVVRIRIILLLGNCFWFKLREIRSNRRQADGAVKFFHDLYCAQAIGLGKVASQNPAMQIGKTIFERIGAPFMRVSQMPPLRESLGSVFI